MGRRTEHPPGTFSWVDLTTSDTDGAKAFYGELLGWQFEDSEIPEEAGGGVYTMCRVQGDNAAAISGTRPGDPSPPHWNSYVTVESADEFASKAEGSGGNVLMEPFDVMDAGRMAVIADPTGAALAVWEPRDSIGAERVNDPGCLTWNELHTPDVDAALGFHTRFFGWNTEEMDTGGGPRYVVLRVGDRSNGGVMPTQQGEPPNWMPYLVVEDRDAAADKAKELGGTELVRMDMPQGQIGVFTDPQGAPFGIWAGQTDD
jgi:predicted enzyme related to lactoylglutathione lyase